MWMTNCPVMEANTYNEKIMEGGLVSGQVLQRLGMRDDKEQGRAEHAHHCSLEVSKLHPLRTTTPYHAVAWVVYRCQNPD